MHTRLFLGVLALSTPLFIKSVSYKNHELITDAVQEELDGSRNVHEKLGQPTYYEKQHSTITFRKETKDDVSVKKIIMKWNGPHIKQLKGALFKKTDEELIPIHENQVSQGMWDETHQRLIFTFKTAHPLRGITAFSVVLTVNPELDEILKQGTFTLDDSVLPEPFRDATKTPLTQTPIV